MLNDHQRNEILTRVQGQANLMRLFRRGEGVQEIVGALTHEVMAQLGPTADISQAMSEVQRLYQEMAVQVRHMSVNSARQSWVTASGNAFQALIQGHINTRLNRKEIYAVSARELRRLAPHLISFLMLPARRRCVQERLDTWPDTDIILLTQDRKKNWKVFGLVSCKTSFHARETESCFWALAIRDIGIRYTMVTQDLRDELGTEKRPTKARKLLEAYFNRVYSTNPRTSHCPQIQPLEVEDRSILCEDIERWRDNAVA